MPASIVWNRKPLPQRPFAPLPLSAVTPSAQLLSLVSDTPAAALDDRLAKAYLSGDAALKQAAEKEIEEVLAGCAPDRFALRALLRHHGATNDRRVPAFLMQHAKSVSSSARSAEEAADAGDLLRALLFLYNLSGQQALLELCRKIKGQAPDWTSTFHVFPMTKPAPPGLLPGTDAYCRVSGATVAASLKIPALQALFEGGLKNENAFRVGFDKLIRCHGAAHGLFNADPLLSGANPSKTVDPETVSELLYTLETLLWASPDPAIADLYEAIAYGALPAAVGPQAANQLWAGHGARAGYAAAFAASQWMATSDGGLAAIGYGPCAVRWRLGGHAVRIAVETKYPYEDRVRVRIALKSPCRFPIRLRTPAWAEGASVAVCGEEATEMTPGFCAVDREWRDGDTLDITLPSSVRTTSAYHQSLIVSRGPLTYALPVEAGAEWRYALLPGLGFEPSVEQGIPVVYAHAAPTDGWAERDGRPAPPPIAPQIDTTRAVRLRLVPYARTDRRIAQFPAAKPER